MKGGAATTMVAAGVLNSVPHPGDLLTHATRGLVEYIANMPDGADRPGDLVLLMVPEGDGQQVMELIWGVLSGNIKTLQVPTVERP